MLRVQGGEWGFGLDVLSLRSTLDNQVEMSHGQLEESRTEGSGGSGSCEPMDGTNSWEPRQESLQGCVQALTCG